MFCLVYVVVSGLVWSSRVWHGWVHMVWFGLALHCPFWSRLVMMTMMMVMVVIMMRMTMMTVANCYGSNGGEPLRL